MPAIEYIKHRFGSAFLVWLKKSNLYVHFEEPAWFVFKRTVKRYKLQTIADECVVRYGLSPEESLKYVTDIRCGIEKMNHPMDIGFHKNEYPEDLENYAFEPYSVYSYKFGETIVEFSFETRNFEYYIHPLITHLETTQLSTKNAVFELFAFYDKIAFRLNGEIKGLWTYDETHLVKGLIFMNLVNVIFDKREDFWLMTVHASALTNGQKTILFPAEAGSGKTTIAALLQNRGFKMVSDDFVPIDRKSYAYPFPIAMSVKQGAVEVLASVFPDLEQKPLNFITSEKSVRYVRPKNDGDFDYQSFPVKEFVFIRYDQTVDFEIIQLDAIVGVKLLLEQAWVAVTEGTPEILFDCLAKWSFFQLSYSNNSKAIEAVTKLFEHD